VRARHVYDLVYNPPTTLLLDRARRRGLRVLPGVEMFLAQGAAQFRLFTGRTPPLDVMRSALEEALRRASGAGGRDAARRGPARPPARIHHARR
jgi:shikimate 5-dehydrogenase